MKGDQLKKEKIHRIFPKSNRQIQKMKITNHQKVNWTERYNI